MTARHKFTNIKTADLIPYARNSRTHSKEQVAQIAASIKEFGFTNPVLVGEDNVLIAGHGRLLAAQKLGLDDVPAVVIKGLTDTQKRALVLADNRIALSGAWDDEMLAIEFQALKDEDYDLALTGFDEDEISKFITEPHGWGQTDEDEVTEPPVVPVTVLGDVWLLGNHRLMCGDSTSIDAVEKLMDGKKADMVFTDPPYGVNYEGGHFHSGDVKIKRKREKLASDNTTAIYFDFLPVMLKFVDGACYMWFADSKAVDVYNALRDNNCDTHALIIWHKTNATYAAMNAQYKQRHEPCVYFKPKGSTLRWCGDSKESTLWSQDRDGINDFHPTQKPVALAEKAIKNHTAKSVLDLFLGSGSTLIACEKTGRTCYGMELSEAYVDVIIKRWQDFTGLEAVHAETGAKFNDLTPKEAAA